MLFAAPQHCPASTARPAATKPRPAIDLAKLEARVALAQDASSTVMNDERMRNIAFGSAGHLSRASRNRLVAWRDSIGKATTKSLAAKLVLSVARGETQQRINVLESFKLLSTPVEMQAHDNLVCAHADTITAGDYAKMLRICMAKFDKRLAQRLPITLEVGSRAVTLAPTA